MRGPAESPVTHKPERGLEEILPPAPTDSLSLSLPTSRSEKTRLCCVSRSLWSFVTAGGGDTGIEQNKKALMLMELMFW